MDVVLPGGVHPCGGRPRIVSRRYLGSAAEIAARLAEKGPGEPDRTRHLTFGDVAAAWSVLLRLGVAEIVDDVVGVGGAPADAQREWRSTVGARRETRGHRSGPTSRSLGSLTGAEQGGRPVLEARLLRLVGIDRWRPAVEILRSCPRSSALLGGDGCHRRGGLQ